MTTRITTPPTNKRTPHYLFPINRFPAADATILNTRVYLQLIELEFPTTIDAVVFNNGATAAGNIRVGIYSAGASDTPAGGTLQRESASTAIGAVFSCQIISLSSSVTLAAGQYWIALCCSNATTTPVRNGNYAWPAGTVCTFDQAFGALPTTCPAITDSSTSLLNWVRTA